MPVSVKRDMLLFPFVVGKHQSQPGLPQPKLPNHTEPWGATVTPKPAPRMPPPVRGDRGVPLLPSAGWPLDFNTKLKVHEFGEPCVVFTHAASKLASDRVERSEFVWSAFGELNNTAEDCPVAGATMLSFIPAAIWRPKELPEITPVR